MRCTVQVKLKQPQEPVFADPVHIQAARIREFC
jgi:hypothetical protein